MTLLFVIPNNRKEVKEYLRGVRGTYPALDASPQDTLQVELKTAESMDKNEFSAQI